jgi:hypothetical protein
LAKDAMMQLSWKNVIEITHHSYGLAPKASIPCAAHSFDFSEQIICFPSDRHRGGKIIIRQHASALSKTCNYAAYMKRDAYVKTEMERKACLYAPQAHHRLAPNQIALLGACTVCTIPTGDTHF